MKTFTIRTNLSNNLSKRRVGCLAESLGITFSSEFALSGFISHVFFPLERLFIYIYRSRRNKLISRWMIYKLTDL